MRRVRSSGGHTPNLHVGRSQALPSDELECQNRVSSVNCTKNLHPLNDAQKDWDGSKVKGDIRGRGALCLAPAPKGQHTFSWCLKLAGDGQGPRGADLCWSPLPQRGFNQTSTPPEAHPRASQGQGWEHTQGCGRWLLGLGMRTCSHTARRPPPPGQAGLQGGPGRRDQHTGLGKEGRQPQPPHSPAILSARRESQAC